MKRYEILKEGQNVKLLIKYKELNGKQRMQVSRFIDILKLDEYRDYDVHDNGNIIIHKKNRMQVKLDKAKIPYIIIDTGLI